MDSGHVLDTGLTTLADEVDIEWEKSGVILEPQGKWCGACYWDGGRLGEELGFWGVGVGRGVDSRGEDSRWESSVLFWTCWIENAY